MAKEIDANPKFKEAMDGFIEKHKINPERIT